VRVRLWEENREDGGSQLLLFATCEAFGGRELKGGEKLWGGLLSSGRDFVMPKLFLRARVDPGRALKGKPEERRDRYR